MYIPIVFLLLFSANILEKLGQDPQVVDQAKYFLYTLIPGSLIIGLEDL
jgi:Na+-driven multidrug efflux pump